MEVAKVEKVSLFQPDKDIDRHIRLVEHLAQHREIVAQHYLVGGQPMRGNDGAPAAEMIGGADVVAMFMAEDQPVYFFRRAADMLMVVVHWWEFVGQHDADT